MMYFRYLLARFLGFVLRYVFGLTCGFLEDSTYMNRPCVLVPGHSDECMSAWESTRTKPVRYWWRRDGDAAGGKLVNVRCEVGE